MDLNTVNVLVFAYLGDTIYEDYIRKYLIINKRVPNVNDLQKKAINYVSATSQAAFLNDLIEKNFFNEEELSVIRRARNYKSKSHPKGCDIVTYKHATALEAVIGYLELSNNHNRINALMEQILEVKIC